jgi:predicted SAM-dependent methyltransferase
MKPIQTEYIQFGCGPFAPESWQNFDAGPAFWLQKNLPILKPMLIRRGYPDYPKNILYGDVIQGLPVKPQSAKAVYCSHVLEHMALDEFRVAIRNVFQYLRPGGCFRLVVPDLEFYAKEYIADSRDDAASRFMRETHLGEKSMIRGLRSMPRALFGRSKHFWMWDYRGIARELTEAGFVNVRRAQFADSADPKFKDVENPGRWENCLGVECHRPA